MSSCNNPAPGSSEDLKAELKNLVPGFDSESERLQEDLMNKYKSMLAVAKANNQSLSEDEIKTRLNNYIKGWKYHNFENTSRKGDVFNEGVTFNSEDEMKAAYLQYGKETAELYDQDNDGASACEILYARLKDLYVAKRMNIKQVTAKAIEVTEKFSNGDLNDNDPLYVSDERALYLDILQEIVVKDRNGDERLSAEELAIDRLATAQCIDNKNSVMHEEAKLAEMAVKAAGLSEDEIMDEFNVSRESAKEIMENSKAYYTSYNMATSFLTGENIDIHEMFNKTLQ